MRNVSEMTTRLVHPIGISVAHKPTSTLNSLLMNVEEPTNTIEQINVVYKIREMTVKSIILAKQKKTSDACTLSINSL